MRTVAGQDALARGALSAELLRRWLRLARTPLLGPLAKAVPGFRDRILGNPRFLLVLAIELAMGVSAKTSAEMKARGDKFGKVCVVTPRRCRQLIEVAAPTHMSCLLDITFLRL